MFGLFEFSHTRFRSLIVVHDPETPFSKVFKSFESHRNHDCSVIPFPSSMNVRLDWLPHLFNSWPLSVILIKALCCRMNSTVARLMANDLPSIYFLTRLRLFKTFHNMFFPDLRSNRQGPLPMTRYEECVGFCNSWVSITLSCHFPMHWSGCDGGKITYISWGTKRLHRVGHLILIEVQGSEHKSHGRMSGICGI